MKFILLVLLIAPMKLMALSCGDDHSENVAFKKSKSVYVIKIGAIELYKEPDNYVKLLKVEYKVNQTLKGNKKSKGYLIEASGISTGYVGFIPGFYYIVAMPERSDPDQKLDFITYCDVLGAPYFNQSKELKNKIEILLKNYHS